ncbi:MAG: C39 family peptidase [Anaerolineae bacterium]|nr:C39 family peptidase [Anaerolineae bacterium]
MFVLPDALGSVRQTVDISGTVTATREWSPFGVEGGSTQTGLGYTGEWQDAYSALVYLRARWYDAYLNHFTSPDTVIPDFMNPQSLDRYSYVLNNPINYIDPSGYEPDPLAPLPSLENTPILDVPWIDEMGDLWVKYPNSCGVMALYMFLHGEGLAVDLDTLVQQLRQQRPGGYDGYCCSLGWGGQFPTPTPDPLGWCNRACVSAETLAEVARVYYGLTIESGDHWTRERVHHKLLNNHPVLALVRVELSTNQFGHFVVVRGLIDQGLTVVFNDSYPGSQRRYWRMTPEERQAIGDGREAEWSDFDRSWASQVDSMDPQGKDTGGHVGWASIPEFSGHVRWAMAVH